MSVSTVLTALQETSAAENKRSKNRNPSALFTFSITNTNSVCLLEALMQQVKSVQKKKWLRSWLSQGRYVCSCHSVVNSVGLLCWDGSDIVTMLFKKSRKTDNRNLSSCLLSAPARARHKDCSQQVKRYFSYSIGWVEWCHTANILL